MNKTAGKNKVVNPGAISKKSKNAKVLTQAKTRIEFVTVSIPSAVKQSQQDEAKNKSLSRRKYEIFIYFSQTNSGKPTAYRRKRIQIGRKGKNDAYDLLGKSQQAIPFMEQLQPVSKQKTKQLLLGEPEFSSETYYKNGAFLNHKFWEENLLYKTANPMQNLEETIVHLKQKPYLSVLDITPDVIPEKISHNFLRDYYDPDRKNKAGQKAVAPPAPEVQT